VKYIEATQICVVQQKIRVSCGVRSLDP
jgi:hypothetical protein